MLPPLVLAVAILLCGDAASAADSLSAADFANPPSTARPKARYWIKDAYAFDAAVGRYDLASLQDAGFGGAEVVHFANYHGETIEDPTYFGLGSGNWSKVLESLVENAVDLGVHLDFCIGAASGGAAVSSYNQQTDPGLQTGVVFGTKSLSGNQSYDGPLPGIDESIWGDRAVTGFVSAAYGKVTGGSTGGVQTLQWSSMVDVSDEVKCSQRDSTTNCTVSFDAPEDSGSYLLIAFWTINVDSVEAPGGFNGAIPGFPASTGMIYTDHFANAGVNATDAFFSTDVLTDRTKELLPQLTKPSYAWQDSLEFDIRGQHWGIDMGKRWKDVRPYGSGLALPSLFTTYFQYDNQTATKKMLNDYKYVLTDGYRSYGQAATSWAHTLGIEYSHQPYGWKAPSMDVTGLATVADAPETESLDFQNNIDGMLHMSGGVHTPTSGGIFSEELGAAAGEQYQITWPEILKQVNPGVAAGVNMLLLHGYSYSGSYANTTWPGYTAFGTSYGNSWGPRGPDWNHSKPVVDFMARNFLIGQTGKAKLDLAFWSWNAMDKNGTRRDSFVQSGFTYEYLSTMSLEHENNFIQDGKLNPDNGAYKAFVFPEITAMEYAGMEKILKFAHSGFPMVFYGSQPSATTNLIEGGDEFIQSSMEELLSLDNVKYVGSEAEAVSALQDLGVQQTTSFSTPVKVYSVHHSTSDLDVVWLHNNESSAIAVDITFSFTGTPYQLDAWTGSITPVAVYQQNDGSTTIPVSIPSGATAIYAFGSDTAFADVATPDRHVTSTDISYPTVQDGSIALRETQNATRQVQYSDGSKESLDYQVPAPTQLSNWDLTIEEFNPPDDMTDADPTYESAHSTSQWNVTELVPWLEIDDSLADVSGVGTYKTSFEYDGNSAGAFLNLTGPVFHTVEVFINGERADSVNLWQPVIDISKNLKNGTNNVSIVTASTLFNAVSSVASEVWSAGDSGAGYADDAKQKYGLVGEVFVNWYETKPTG